MLMFIHFPTALVLFAQEDYGLCEFGTLSRRHIVVDPLLYMISNWQIF